MKIPPIRRTRMLTPTKGERLTANPAVVFSLFLLVFSLTSLIKDYGFQWTVEAIRAARPHHVTFSLLMLIQLGFTLITVVGVLLYCLLAEKRSLLSLGFTGKGAVGEYTAGLLGGVILFGGAVLLCRITGALTVEVAEETPSWGLLTLFFLGFLIQGMSEEMLCRSYLMVSLSRGWPLWSCALLNSLIFAILHLGNANVSVVALVNIFLFGLFASLLTLRRGSIWMVGALHSMWNFAQGNLFGIPVSGIRGLPSPLVSTSVQGGWQEWLNGGAFGLEGGLAVTAVMAIACFVVLLVPTKKREIAESHPTDP